MMRELKYNDFNSSSTTLNRYNISNYLSYNNIHHYQQQIQFKRYSPRHKQQTHINQSIRYSQQNQENNIHKVN